MQAGTRGMLEELFVGIAIFEGAGGEVLLGRFVVVDLRCLLGRLIKGLVLHDLGLFYAVEVVDDGCLLISF
jgi:hypothetical protein